MFCVLQTELSFLLIFHCNMSGSENKNDNIFWKYVILYISYFHCEMTYTPEIILSLLPFSFVMHMWRTDSVEVLHKWQIMKHLFIKLHK
jgi:hypothetical protein